MTPEKIGRYNIEGELGRGAMGQVFRAHDPNIGRQLAIKTVPLDTGNADMRARFQREAQAAGRLAHPNIVTIYDAGEENGILYIAMELVEGESLADVLDSGPLSAAQAISVGQQIASGLAHAHQQSIVHRDIKPANVMVSGASVKIMDFGVARLASAGLTATGQVLGTPAYLPPEVIQGQPADARSDIFALGVVLYEGLTGKRPFDGENISAVMFKVLTERPTDPHLTMPAVPSSLSALVMKSIEKVPAERFQSCDEMLAALKACQTELGADGAAAPMIARSALGKPAATGSSFRQPTVATGKASGPMATLPLPNPTPAPAPAGTVAGTTAGTMDGTLAGSSADKRGSSAGVMAIAAVLVLAIGVGIWWSQRSGSSGTGAAPAAGQSMGATAGPGGSPRAIPGASRSETSQPASPSAQTPATGSLQVSSTPRGARISIDGMATRRTTPANIELSPGEHKIRIEAEGFAAQERDVTIDAGESFLLNVEMKKPGLIRRINPF